MFKNGKFVREFVRVNVGGSSLLHHEQLSRLHRRRLVPTERLAPVNVITLLRYHIKVAGSPSHWCSAFWGPPYRQRTTGIRLAAHSKDPQLLLVPLLVIGQNIVRRRSFQLCLTGPSARRELISRADGRLHHRYHYACFSALISYICILSGSLYTSMF